VEVSDAAAILVLRVWFEGDPPSALRVRLLEVTDGSTPDRVIATVATVDALVVSVRAWVEGLMRR
jgi:hypothetical protein